MGWREFRGMMIDLGEEGVQVIGDYTRSTRVECFWICSRNVAIFVETFA